MSALRYGLQLGAAVFGLGLAALVAPQLSPEAAADASADGATGVSTAAPAQGRAAAASVRSARTPAKVTAAAPVSRSAPAAAASAPAPAPAGPRGRILDLPASAAPRASGLPAQELLSKVLGTQVTFINRTGAIIAVAQVPKGGRNDAEAETVFLRPGEAGFYSGDNWGANNYDVRLRVYDVVIDPATGTAQRGVMSQIIAATNTWSFNPFVRVFMDPYRVTTTIDSQMFNRFLVKGGTWSDWKEGQSWNADYRLQGPNQQGVTATYMERKADSDDHKIFLIEAYSIPVILGTQDYSTDKAGRVYPNL